MDIASPLLVMEGDAGPGGGAGSITTRPEGPGDDDDGFGWHCNFHTAWLSLVKPSRALILRAVPSYLTSKKQPLAASGNEETIDWVTLRQSSRLSSVCRYRIPKKSTVSGQ